MKSSESQQPARRAATRRAARASTESRDGIRYRLLWEAAAVVVTCFVHRWCRSLSASTAAWLCRMSLVAVSKVIVPCRVASVRCKRVGALWLAQFGAITAAGLREPFRPVAVPAAQLGRGGDCLDPFIDMSGAFGESPWPEHKYALAIVGRWLIIGALQAHIRFPGHPVSRRTSRPAEILRVQPSRSARRAWCRRSSSALPGGSLSRYTSARRQHPQMAVLGMRASRWRASEGLPARDYPRVRLAGLVTMPAAEQSVDDDHADRDQGGRRHDEALGPQCPPYPALPARDPAAEGGQGERRQHGGEPGVGTTQRVLDPGQGLPLSRCEAHDQPPVWTG